MAAYKYINGNPDLLPKVLREILRMNHYPPQGTDYGGAGNYCAARLHSNKDVGKDESGQPFYSRRCHKCNLICDRFAPLPDMWDVAVFARNEGQGGMHSEIVVSRYSGVNSVRGQNVEGELFTERAPCDGCRESLNRYGDDLMVYFAIAWTDTDSAIDPVSFGLPPTAQAAGDARTAVRDWRRRFHQFVARHS
jgi:hypothetical protein